MDDLRIGIIAEGKSDAAIITNILKGILKVDKSQFKYIRPEFSKDETELNDESNKDETDLNSESDKDRTFSNWTLVKRDCIEKTEINKFLDSQIEGDRILIIQIDTAERNEIGYEVFEPKKSKTKKYSEELRDNVIQKINEWLNHPYENIFYAIAIEEIDAWLLTLIDKSNNDTGFYLNAKKKFNQKINKNASHKIKKILKLQDAFKKHDQLSEPLSKQRELTKARNKNHSLNLFCASLENQLLQKTEME